MPFTSEHQPSLEVKRARSNNTTAHEGVTLVERERSTFDTTHTIKTFKTNHVCGVVQCKDCTKTRCLYSIDTPILMKPLAGIDGREPSQEGIKAFPRVYRAAVGGIL